MKVLVATDAIGTRSSAQAGAIIASAWVDAVPGAQVAVVPVGEAGAGFLTALADLDEVEAVVTGDGSTLSLSVHGPDTLGVGLDPAPVGVWSTAPTPELAASSYALGSAVRTALTVADQTGPRLRTLLVDLGGLDSLDGGAGLLAGLGATADVPLTAGVTRLTGLTEVDLDPVRRLLAGTRVVGVVPHDERDRVLLGLRGITSRLRTPGSDPAELLAVDTVLATLARLCAGDGTERAALPGAGAAGGAAFAILALGGELTTGTAYLGDRLGLHQTLARSDLVVTGCTVFDFATRGGGVVTQLARRAEQALRPCIAIAGEVLIGGRELRTMGVEAAYPVVEANQVDPDDRTAAAVVGGQQLSATAHRVARTWSW